MAGLFDIEIRYSGNSLYQSAFDAAAARWEQVITADIGDVVSPTYGFIDDLLIDASVVNIDGVGGILGQAGPDEFRSGSWLPDHGIMQFDSADVQQMYNAGTLTNVIIHEIGHILGIGTLWSTLGLKSGSNYIGPNAVAQYKLMSGNTSATSVPLETGGGSGTAGSHWSESIFDAELMTGFAENGPMPLSTLTIGALQDIGYTVNYAAADSYYLPGSTAMKIAYFQAVDSVTGDYFQGIAYDSTGRYDLGDTYSFANNRGGTWTYRILDVRTADSTHQNPFYNGKVYDTFYYDASLGIGGKTNTGFVGYNYGAPADLTNFSGTNYLGSDGDYVVLNGYTHRFSYNVVVPEPMKVAYFHAVDSSTGDYFDGLAYDNTGRYHLNDTYTFANNLGGTWTYRIIDLRNADSAHQDPYYTGKVYDTFYFDASLGSGAKTNTGFIGYNYGAPLDLTNYSGNNYIGSDGDYVVLNGVTQRFSYNVVAPPVAVMKLASFQATDSVTGDYFYGIAYDNTDTYHLGDTFSFANDRGGTWTYRILDLRTADTAHQNPFYTGKVYDTYYYDASLGTGRSTNTGFLGYNYGAPLDLTNFSGTNYLGSDGDYVVLNGFTHRFSSSVVVPGPMKMASFQATDSVTGDYFYGIAYDNTDRYHLGDTFTFANDRGGTWTYRILDLRTADSAHQDPFYTGKVYDTFYYDASIGVGSKSNTGFLGYNYGAPLDLTNFSGTNYLGSDGDYVVLNGITYRFSSTVVVPGPMKVAAFQATDSATGDYFYGIAYDNTDRYHLGDTFAFANDRGGFWTYSILDLKTADSAHQDPFYNGKVYDTFYFDASLGVGAKTITGFLGYNYGAPTDRSNFSGNNFVGSDADYVVLNGVTHRFAYNHPVPLSSNLAEEPTSHALLELLGANAAGGTFDFVHAPNDLRFVGYDAATLVGPDAIVPVHPAQPPAFEAGAVAAVSPVLVADMVETILVDPYKADGFVFV